MTPLAGDRCGSGGGGYSSASRSSYSSSRVSSGSTVDVPSIKCVLVGDGAVGKTSLVVSYTRNGFPTEYIPTAFDNYTVLVTVDGRKIKLHLCDTAGQDDFDRLRPLCYQDADVFLLCYSVVCPTSYANARDKWLGEIRCRCPDAPVIVVGTQTDLRCDVRVAVELHRYGEVAVTRADGERLARSVGALAYVECSALTQSNMKDVFDAAIVAALERRSATASVGGSGVAAAATAASIGACPAGGRASTSSSLMAAAAAAYPSRPPPPPPRRRTGGGSSSLAAVAAAKAKKHRGLRSLLCCVSAR